MSIRTSSFLLIGISWLTWTASSWAVSVQDPNASLPDGSVFLWVEGEDVFELGGADPSIGFQVVDNVNPIQTISQTTDGLEVEKGGLDVLPADTNASGGAALLDQLGGGNHSNTAKWQVQFAIPATYYLYLHYSFYNRDTNTNYSNEDSIFVPPSFNANASNDWIGFEGIDELGEPKTGDSIGDGWMPLSKNIVSEGDVESHNSTDEDFWDGQFHWMWADVAVDVNADNAFVDDFGHSIQYEVTEADVGTVLDFEISSREPYGVIDGLLFSTSNELLFNFSQDQMDEFFLNQGGPVQGDFDGSGALDLADVNMLNAEIAGGTNNADFDLNGDEAVNEADLNIWVKDLRVTWFGDGNLDSEFNSGDLVNVFQEGKYDLDEAAGWNQGDWNGDLRFDSGDLVKAFQDGGYELGPPAPANAVPEPSAVLLILVGLALIKLRRR